MKTAPRLLQTSVLLLLSATGFAQEHRADTEAQSPAATRQRLEQGNARHRNGEPLRARLGAGARRTAARSQNPIAVVLGCSDCDVTPEFAFDAGLGELVVLRTAGHGLDAGTLASIEEAVCQLGATTLVVLGHDECDAIRAAAEADRDHPVLGASALDHLSRLDPSVQRGHERARNGETLATAIAEDHAAATAADCLRRSAELRRLQALGRFEALPARYDAATGEVRWLPLRAVAATDDEQLRAPHAAPPSMAPHVALRALVAGNRRFVGDGPLLGKHGPAPLGEKRSQPMAVVLACSDARVVPELLFDCGSGELCVVRTKDAELTPAALASIELAVARTGAPLLLTLGHSKCRGEDSAARAQKCAAEAIQRSALLRGLEAQGRFFAAAAHYDLETGDVAMLPETRMPTTAKKTDDVGNTHGAHASHDVEQQHGSHDAHATTPEPHGEPHAPAAAHDAAPHGETKADSHGEGATHGTDAGKHDDGHPASAHAESHGHDAHADTTPAAAHDAAPHAESHGADQHANPDAHAAHEPKQEHADPHGSGAHTDPHASSGHAGTHADEHGDAHASGAHADEHGDAHATKPGNDGSGLVTIVGSAAILSIAVAMLLSLKKRG